MQNVFSGGKEDTTNNEMELTAVLEALKYFENKYNGTKDKLIIYSDSAYIVNTVNEKWYIRWMKEGWVTTAGTSIKNREIWENIIQYILKYDISFKKVKAHATDEYNQMVDRAAREETEKILKGEEKEDIKKEDNMDTNNNIETGRYLVLDEKTLKEKFADVNIIDPKNTYITENSKIGKGSIIYPNVYIENSKIAENVIIYPRFIYF